MGGLAELWSNWERIKGITAVVAVAAEMKFWLTEGWESLQNPHEADL